MPDGPTKSQISKELEDRGFIDIKPHSIAESFNSVTTLNPILGFSESEPKRKRLREEYSEYVRNGLKEEMNKSRSRSRRNRGTNDSYEERSDYMSYHNEYAQKQRYQHSYFKYANSNPIVPASTTNLTNVAKKVEKERTEYSPSIGDRNQKHGILKNNILIEDRKNSNDPRMNDSSPARTVISIIPDYRGSPLDKERQK